MEDNLKEIEEHPVSGNTTENNEREDLNKLDEEKQIDSDNNSDGSDFVFLEDDDIKNGTKTQQSNNISPISTCSEDEIDYLPPEKTENTPILDDSTKCVQRSTDDEHNVSFDGSWSVIADDEPALKVNIHINNCSTDNEQCSTDGTHSVSSDDSWSEISDQLASKLDISTEDDGIEYLTDQKRKETSLCNDSIESDQQSTDNKQPSDDVQNIFPDDSLFEIFNNQVDVNVDSSAEDGIEKGASILDNRLLEISDNQEDVKAGSSAENEIKKEILILTDSTESDQSSTDDEQSFDDIQHTLFSKVNSSAEDDINKEIFILTDITESDQWLTDEEQSSDDSLFEIGDNQVAVKLDSSTGDEIEKGASILDNSSLFETGDNQADKAHSSTKDQIKKENSILNKSIEGDQCSTDDEQSFNSSQSDISDNELAFKDDDNSTEEDSDGEREERILDDSTSQSSEDCDIQSMSSSDNCSENDDNQLDCDVDSSTEENEVELLSVKKRKGTPFPYYSSRKRNRHSFSSNSIETISLNDDQFKSNENQIVSQINNSIKDENEYLSDEESDSDETSACNIFDGTTWSETSVEDENGHLTDADSVENSNSSLYKKRCYTEHRYFHNILPDDAKKYLERMGDFIIGKSNKGSKNLTVTWVIVINRIYHHIDVKIIDKGDCSFFLVKGKECESIDDIIDKVVAPMITHAIDLMNIKYYKDIEGSLFKETKAFLRLEKEKHCLDTCVISASRDYPGKFLLSYLSEGDYHHRYIKVTKHGFHYKNYIFHSINALNVYLEKRFQHFSSSESIRTLESDCNGHFSKLITEIKLIRSHLKDVLYPEFYDMSFIQAENYLADMEQGDFIIRPSSKGLTNVAISWKVTDKICQHVEIEKQAEHDDCSLWINGRMYKNVHEVIFGYIKPMVKYAQALLQHKDYWDIEYNLKTKIEKVLKEEIKEAVITSSKDFPGKFLFSTLDKEGCKHEVIYVTPNGLHFRSNTYTAINLENYIKKKMED